MNGTQDDAGSTAISEKATVKAKAAEKPGSNGEATTGESLTRARTVSVKTTQGTVRLRCVPVAPKSTRVS